MNYVECPDCGGVGTIEADKPVIDWNHGGYIATVTEECYTCNGFGEVEDEE